LWLAEVVVDLIEVVEQVVEDLDKLKQMLKERFQ
jgi:hypothetical protein